MAELVIVTWEDTINIAAWQTPADVAEWAGEGGWICQNIGWLIYQDDNCVVIAGRRCRDEQEHVGLAERIPRRAILEMNTIPDPDMKQPLDSPRPPHYSPGSDGAPRVPWVDAWSPDQQAGLD